MTLVTTKRFSLEDYHRLTELGFFQHDAYSPDFGLFLIFGDPQRRARKYR